MLGKAFSYCINHHAELLHSFTLRLMKLFTSSFIHVANELFALLGPLFWELSSEWIIVLAFWSYG